MNLTQKDKLEISKQQYNIYYPNDPVTLYKEKITIGYISAFNNNRSGNDEQIYVITKEGVARRLV